MSSNREEAARIGREGERLVAEYLRKNGYIILRRNWRDSRFGEIDIIAESRENIVFVEVKTRSENAIVSGAESIDAHKARRTKTAAEFFMRKLNTNLPPRIDVADLIVEKDRDGKEKWKLKYIKSAM
ncbi:MAG: YraN family protein [Clostridia bacterium]|nr:YraN family protein [Clostridia bacterium]